MIRKITSLASLVLLFLNPDAFGFSSDASSLTKSFDKTIAVTNSAVVLTVTFTNSGTTALRGFCYTDHLPSSLAVTTLDVTLNDQGITNYTFEPGQTGDVYAGCTPCRWRLESPTNFAEANPILPQSRVQIAYSISSLSPGIFSFQQFSWAGYNTTGTNASFGYSEIADQRTVSIVPGALTVSADSKSRVFGQNNPVFTGTISGIQNGDNITATYTTTATANSPVGTYDIAPTLIDPGGKLTNYTVTLIHGTLTIFDAPRFQNISKSSGGLFTLACQVQPGRTYQLQFKNSLSETNWVSVGATFVPASSNWMITNNPGTNLSRFYRILDLTSP